MRHGRVQREQHIDVCAACNGRPPPSLFHRSHGDARVRSSHWNHDGDESESDGRRRPHSQCACFEALPTSVHRLRMPLFPCPSLRFTYVRESLEKEVVVAASGIQSWQWW